MNSIKVLFYGIETKNICLNYDFILNDLIPNHYEVDVDVLTVEQSKTNTNHYDVFVYHCISPTRLAHFGYSPEFQIVKDAVIRHTPKIIIQLIDEYWFEHNEIHNSLGNYCELFLKQHRHHCQVETYTPNTLQIPLGYINGFFDKTKQIKSVYDRKYNWSWVGNLKSDRREMINHFLNIPKGIVGSDGAINHLEMFDVYNDSIFVPSGRGNASLDCWRIYEALLAGAIPVIVGSQHEIECTFTFTQLPPFVYAETWEEASNKCIKLLFGLEQIQFLQIEIKSWWKKIMNDIQDKIITSLK